MSASIPLGCPEATTVAVTVTMHVPDGGPGAGTDVGPTPPPPHAASANANATSRTAPCTSRVRFVRSDANSNAASSPKRHRSPAAPPQLLRATTGSARVRKPRSFSTDLRRGRDGARSVEFTTNSKPPGLAGVICTNGGFVAGIVVIAQLLLREDLLSSPGWAAQLLPSRVLLVVVNPQNPVRDGPTIPPQTRKVNPSYYCDPPGGGSGAHAKFSSPSATSSIPSAGSTSTGSPCFQSATLSSNSRRPRRSNNSRAKLASRMSP
jgi:hypothetical protein